MWAQVSTTPPAVDESKIPEWVKRQARSPYKVIIDSNTVKARPATPKVDAANKSTAKRPPVKTAAAAASETNQAAPASTPATVASPAASAASTQPEVAPAAAVETATLPAPPQPAGERVVDVAPAPAATPATLFARIAPEEPPPLSLLKRIEPVLSPDLLDGRLDSAKVVVAFTVTASGEVSNLSIASTTDPRLNRAVLRALQAWRYAPIPEARKHRVSFAFTTE
ncbi:MAG: TonB family protein [Burkholderiales bacterium]|nr:TonB family protein [Burkholderiales bacterium]